jgi:hypothetical protein
LKQYLSIRQLCKTKKPTGNVPIPEHVEQACKINHMIGGKTGMIDLDDDIERFSDGEDLQVEVQEEVKKEVKDENTNSTGQYVTCHKPIPPSSSCMSTRSASQTLLTNIGLTLDPTSHQSRHSDIALQMSQANYMSSLTSQLCDVNLRADDATQQMGKLCVQLLEMQCRYHDEKLTTSTLKKRVATMDLANCNQQSHTPHTPDVALGPS